jgi:hypothetical protein
MDRRAPLDCHVVFVTKDSTHRALGRARDISVADVYVYTKEPAAIGSPITVEVILPYQFDTIVLPGVVRAVRAGLGMDVKFEELGEAELRAVSEYIDARLRRASGARPIVGNEVPPEEKSKAR